MTSSIESLKAEAQRLFEDAGNADDILAMYSPDQTRYAAAKAAWRQLDNEWKAAAAAVYEIDPAWRPAI